MRLYRFGALLALVFAACTARTLAFAQVPPASPALSADLSRYYFKTPADEVLARAELNSALAELSGFRGKLSSSHQLLNALQQLDAAQKLFARHERYLHLSCARDRKNVACDADKTLQSDFDAKTAFLDPEILAIPEERLRVFLNEEPALGAYRFAIADIRRDAPHGLPEPEQKLLDEFQPQIADWQFELYEQIVAGISFGTVKDCIGRSRRGATAKFDCYRPRWARARRRFQETLFGICQSARSIGLHADPDGAGPDSAGENAPLCRCSRTEV